MFSTKTARIYSGNSVDGGEVFWLLFYQQVLFF